MLKFKYLKNLVLLIVIISFVGCGSDESSEPVILNDYLTSSVKLQSYSSTDVASVAGAFGLSEVSDLLTLGFTVHKIEYKTQYLGEEITASGLISIPTSTASFPLMSLAHGTIASNSEAPSQNITSNLLFVAVASAGYITIVPDFIGFGSSADKIHPYYFEEHIATPCVDMIRAAKEFLKQESIAYEDKLFLGGYSEGGYVTMVTQKLIETSFPDEFNLVASAPSSGGYDVKHMQEYFFSLSTYQQPFFIAYVSMSYKTVLGLDFIADVFKEPYASRIPALFDGSKSGGLINAELTDNVSDLLTENFLANFDTDAKFEPIKNAFLANSPVNWIPKTRTFMYHGTLDITVPYNNSVVSYNKLLAAGASTDIVSFTPLENKTHTTGAIPYFIDVLKKFDALK